jgi:hypothetical protein
MKTWKTIGMVGLLLASVLWSGSVQAKRFDKHAYLTKCNKQVTNPYYGTQPCNGSQPYYGTQPSYRHHHKSRWVAERERERAWREQERLHAWRR